MNMREGTAALAYPQMVSLGGRCVVVSLDLKLNLILERRHFGRCLAAVVHLSQRVLQVVEVPNGVLFLRLGGTHVTKLLFELLEHRLADLELHSPWMMLYGQRILTKVLDQHLILGLVLSLLAHLKYHVLLGFVLLRFAFVFFVFSIFDIKRTPFPVSALFK
jgi:hypothetical protein